MQIIIIVIFQTYSIFKYLKKFRTLSNVILDVQEKLSDQLKNLVEHTLSPTLNSSRVGIALS